MTVFIVKRHNCFIHEPSQLLVITLQNLYIGHVNFIYTLSIQFISLVYISFLIFLSAQYYCTQYLHQTHCTQYHSIYCTMAYNQRYSDIKWPRSSYLSRGSVGHYNKWHQSIKTGRTLPTRFQRDFISRQIQRESSTKFGRCMRQLSQECKAMLKKNMLDIEAYNQALPKPQSNNEEHRRYICFGCGVRGHISANCPNKEEKKHVAEPKEKTQTSDVQITYPEYIHLSTDFMLESTDE